LRDNRRPIGIDAIRATVIGSCGLPVAGTLNHMPGSKWMPVAGSVVMSLMVCRYGTPLRKMSPCVCEPRFGIELRFDENDSDSSVKLSSRTLSDVIGGVNGVGVTVLSGRKIVLKPLPCQLPVNAARGPRFADRTGGGTAGAAACLTS
jgi:hypothetical protein